MKHLINVLASCLKDVSLKRLKSCVNRDNKQTFKKQLKRDISETFHVSNEMFKRRLWNVSLFAGYLVHKNHESNIGLGISIFIVCILFLSLSLSLSLYSVVDLNVEDILLILFRIIFRFSSVSIISDFARYSWIQEIQITKRKGTSWKTEWEDILRQQNCCQIVSSIRLLCPWFLLTCKLLVNPNFI